MQGLAAKHQELPLDSLMRSRRFLFCRFHRFCWCFWVLQVLLVLGWCWCFWFIFVLLVHLVHLFALVYKFHWLYRFTRFSTFFPGCARLFYIIYSRVLFHGNSEGGLFVSVAWTFWPADLPHPNQRNYTHVVVNYTFFATLICNLYIYIECRAACMNTGSLEISKMYWYVAWCIHELWRVCWCEAFFSIISSGWSLRANQEHVLCMWLAPFRPKVYSTKINAIKRFSILTRSNAHSELVFLFV